MSAASKFIDALKHATQSAKVLAPKAVQGEIENHEVFSSRNQAVLPTGSGYAPNSAGLLHLGAAVTGDVNSKVAADLGSNEGQQGLQLPHDMLIDPSHHTGGIGIPSTKPRNMSAPSAGEPPSRPPLPARDSIDDLFSKAESESERDSQETLGSDNEEKNDNTKKQTSASDNELISTEMESQPNDSNNAVECPQISPGTPFHPHQQLSLTKCQVNDRDCEDYSTLSERDRIAHSNDEAFRKALRVVEPSLSKQQQYSAGRNASQDAHVEQLHNATDNTRYREKETTPDRTPSNQYGMEPVEYVDGEPISIDIKTNKAMTNLAETAPPFKSREQDFPASESQEEEAGKEMDEGTGFNDELGARPSTPFSANHKVPAPDILEPDMAKRKRMLETSFSLALQALANDDPERIALNKVDEAHLAKSHGFPQRREWALVEADGSDGDEKRPTHNHAAARGREGSPDSQAAGVGSPPKMDESFATAYESPGKSSSDSEMIRKIVAEMEDEERQLYAKHHDQAMKEEAMEASKRIPGFNPPSSPSYPGTPVPAEPSTPQLPMSYPFNADIRKSIEPETPYRFLDRECTPAFEDRSPTPSPRSLPNNHGDTDVNMGEVPSDSLTFELQHPGKGRHIEPTAPLKQPYSLIAPTPSPHHLAEPQPSEKRQDQDLAQTPAATDQSCPRSPTKPSSMNPTKQRRVTINQNNRRKSAIQGSGAKVEKSKSVPKSRKAANAIFTTATSTTSTSTGGLRTTSSGPKITAEKASKVQQAVERIEKSVRQERMQGERRKEGTRKAREMTPPTRRSKRLMEKRSETPTP